MVLCENMRFAHILAQHHSKASAAGVSQQ